MIGASSIDAEIEEVARPTSWADAMARLKAFCLRHGFDHAVHLLLSPGVKGGGYVFVTTFPDTWIARYFEKDYFSVDPVLPMARRSQTPFQWVDLHEVSPRTKAFFDDARAMGVGSQGLSIPIRDPDGEAAVFSVTSSLEEGDWRELCQRMLPYLQILGLEVHRGLIRLERSAAQGERLGTLSPREREVLRWAASGKTTWETSVLLGLSEQTVQTYLRDAIRRLGCLNKTHAVAEAVRKALI